MPWLLVGAGAALAVAVVAVGHLALNAKRYEMDAVAADLAALAQPERRCR